jgi:hypothetical protein
VKCKIHGIEKKQGGCFQNIYEWCPKCEDADTEPLTDPGLELTPTQPLQIDWSRPLITLDGRFFTSDAGVYVILGRGGVLWVTPTPDSSTGDIIPVEVRGKVLRTAPLYNCILVDAKSCKL